MAQNRIRWTRSDYARLGRAISDFNKKIKELETEENKLYLPEQRNYKVEKKDIQTRAELNRVINSLKRFSNEGAADIVENRGGKKMTRWQQNELNIQKGIAIRTLKADLRELEKPGKSGYSRMQMGSVEANAILATIRSLKKIEEKSGYEFNRIKIRIEDLGRKDYKMIKSIIYRENFMNAVSTNSNLEGYDLLLKKLNRYKNPVNFYNFIKQSDVFSDIFLYYKPR